MDKAPERIWAYPSNVSGWNKPYCRTTPAKMVTEYVRADLYEQVKAQSDRFCEKYLAALSRAEAAERLAGARVKPETQGPYEARICNDIPAECCDYGVVSLSEGREVCRVWREQDARAIAAALAEPAGEAEPVAETYYTKGKDADWVEALSDKDLAWALTCASQDLNDSDENVSRWMPVTAFLSVASDRIKALTATPPDASAIRGATFRVFLRSASDDAVFTFALKSEMDDFLKRVRSAPVWSVTDIHEYRCSTAASAMAALAGAKP